MSKDQITIPVETAEGPRNTAPVAEFISSESDSQKQCHIGESQDFKDSITEIARKLVMPFKLKLTIDNPTPERVNELLDEMMICIDGIPSDGETHSEIYYANGIFNHAIWLLLVLQNAKTPIDYTAAFCEATMYNIVILLIKKNNDYGNSFGNQLAKHGPIVFKIRMEDKVSRLRTLMTTEAQVKDESIIDTLHDIIGYCILFLHHYQTK